METEATWAYPWPSPGPAVPVAGSASSERVECLFAALATAQAELATAHKGALNPHLKSRYADLASVWQAWQAVGPRQGLALVQLPSYDGTWAEVVSRLAHGMSGQWIQSALRLPVGQHTPQGIGSAITYARRYALAALVGVAPEDDDGQAAMPATKAEPERPAATRRAARLATGGKPGPTPAPEPDPAPAPAPADIKRLKGEVWSLILQWCGVERGDGTHDIPATRTQASHLLLDANQDGIQRVPVGPDGLADLAACTPAQYEALKAWLTVAVIDRQPQEGDPF